jgi:hypothetical protein
MAMFKFIHTILFCLLAGGWGVSFASPSLSPVESENVGKVVFVLGVARIVDTQGNEQPAVRGAAINVGSQVITGDRSRVGIRMVDGAREEVFANSIFAIEAYHYDPLNPKASEVKFSLEAGGVLSETGEAGHAAKEKYRLNTPLAAIGIRGTEYIVQVGQDFTQVQVLSGGVVMSGFDGRCRAEGIGPCQGSNATVLMAEQRDKVMVLKKGQQRPELVPVSAAVVSPTAAAPAAKAEAAKAADDSSKTEGQAAQTSEGGDASSQASGGTTAASGGTTAASGGTTAASGGTTAASGTSSSAAITDLANATATTQGVKLASLEQRPDLKWGRWDPGLEKEALDSGYEIVAQSGDYTIMRQKGVQPVIPETGVYHFAPTGYQATIKDANFAIKKANISNADLKIDFAKRNFDTSFTVASQDISANVKATGTLDDQGLLKDDGTNPGTFIKGAMGADKSTASTIFTHNDLDKRFGASGVIDWVTPVTPSVAVGD